MVWKKLQKANIIFMKDCDEGIIIRSVLFNLNILIGFVVNIPSFFSFPMILTLALIFFWFNIGLSTLSLIGVFFISFIFLLLFTWRVVKQDALADSASSKRTLLLVEMMKKFRQVKANNFEKYFLRKITKLRDLETDLLQSSDRYVSYSTFLIDLSGLLAVISILYTQTLMDKTMDVATTFVMVSLVMNMKRPFNRFRSIIVFTSQFNIARNSLSILFNDIEDRPAAQI